VKTLMDRMPLVPYFEEAAWSSWLLALSLNASASKHGSAGPIHAVGLLPCKMFTSIHV
jgi:hypothetical protein